MIITAVLALAIGVSTQELYADSTVAEGAGPEYRTWTRDGQKLDGVRFYRYGGRKYPYEVWLEPLIKPGDRPVRVRVPLDSLSQEDVDFIRANHPDGFPPDYVRKINTPKQSVNSTDKETHMSRTWTDKTGRKLEAVFVDVSGETVKLKKDGKVYSLPVSSLSVQDREFIKSIRDKEQKRNSSREESVQPADKS